MLRQEFQQTNYIGGDTNGVVRPMLNYRLNSIWDPDMTGFGTTVTGYGQFKGLFSRYIVHACKWTVHMELRDLAAPSTSLAQGVKAWARVSDAYSTTLTGAGATTEFTLAETRQTCLPRGWLLAASSNEPYAVYEWPMKDIVRNAGATSAFVSQDAPRAVARFSGYHRIKPNDVQAPQDIASNGANPYPDPGPYSPTGLAPYSSLIDALPRAIRYLTVGATPVDVATSGATGPTIVTPVVPFIFVRVHLVYYVEYYGPLGIAAGEVLDGAGASGPQTDYDNAMPNAVLSGAPNYGADPTP